MKDDAFRTFLASSLTPGTVVSYLANLRRVERTLHVTIDALDLSDIAMPALKSKLAATGMPAPKQGDCVSALRQYAAFRSGRAKADTALARSVPTSNQVAPPITASPRSASLVLHSVPELMRLYANILEELRQRGVLRSSNAPIGDYAEMLFTQAFGWSLQGNSTSGFDAVDDAGLRYQIKARRISARSPSRQLGALRKLSERNFDILAAVLFDEQVGIIRAALVPYDIVVKLSQRVEHTNSWRFILNDGVWTIAEVSDVTERLKAVLTGSQSLTKRAEPA